MEDIHIKVLDPLFSLGPIYEKYNRAFQEHKKRSQDSIQPIAQSRVNKKPSGRVEQFLALDKTLKDELPKLFLLTDKLFQACLGEFVEIQESWYRSLEENLKIATGIDCIDVQDIINDWNSSVLFPGSEIDILGICNGSILDSSIAIPPASPARDSNDS